MPQDAEYFTADELVQRWNSAVKKGTLNNWRSACPPKGPPFVKFGNRVRYPVADVLQWERANKITPANDNSDETKLSA